MDGTKNPQEYKECTGMRVTPDFKLPMGKLTFTNLHKYNEVLYFFHHYGNGYCLLALFYNALKWSNISDSAIASPMKLFSELP